MSVVIRDRRAVGGSFGLARARLHKENAIFNKRTSKSLDDKSCLPNGGIKEELPIKNAIYRTHGLCAVLRDWTHWYH